MREKVLALVAALFCGCGAFGKDYPSLSRMVDEYLVEGRDRAETHTPVSIIQLLASPEMYDNQYISVIGVLSCTDKRPWLFRDEFTYRAFDVTEMIGLPHMPDHLKARCASDAEGEVVRVVGLFEMPRSDVDDYSIGRIRSIVDLTFVGFTITR